MNEMISTMLQRFRDGVPSYQPAAQGLVLESADPQGSLQNLRRLMKTLMIRDILVRPTGVLVVFASGEHHYCPSLRVGPEADTLAEIAAEAGFGDYTKLFRLYSDMPADYAGQLPTFKPEAVPTGKMRKRC